MGSDQPSPLPAEPAPLTRAGRYLVLATAFLGWLFGGVIMQTTSLAMHPAALDLLSRVGQVDLARYEALSQAAPAGRGRAAAADLSATDLAQLKNWRKLAQSWYAFYTCAWLFGAATGGLVFGRLGDRFGRSTAMAASILWYSVLAGVASTAQTPVQLLVCWYFACMGVGGIWPNGVALLAETWSNLSRPMTAGIMGTAANVGIFGLATLGTYVKVTPDNWQWVMQVAAAPVALGLFALAFVPESPRWLAARAAGAAQGKPAAATTQVFRPPFLGITLVGILLATVPLFGGWGSANWMVPWAAEAPDPYLKAQVSQARSLTGIVGSLLGGWVAHAVGRRSGYFLSSLAALFCAQYAFWFTVPTDPSFLFWVAALGFFSGIFFGWMPLFLPELFPTRVRSTGAGVSFNFGRILTAVTVFATGALVDYFGGDYARIGRITSLCYAVGALVIWLAPDTTKRQLED